MTISQFTIVVNDLAEVQFISGTQQVFEFDIYDSTTGSGVDLSAMTTKWALSPYGQPNFLSILKDGVLSGTPNNRFSVTLENADTSGSYGKFTQQPILLDFQGNEFRPSQGLVTIIPANR